MARSLVKYQISTGPVITANGDVLTETDYERMAPEAETAEIDVERLLTRARVKSGRPSLGEGISPVLQVRSMTRRASNWPSGRRTRTPRRRPLFARLSTRS